MNIITSLAERWRTTNPQLKLFLCGMALVGMAGGIFETTFNNFLDDSFRIGASERGMLEFPRELPGFLVALVAGMLCFLPETYIAAASAFAVGLGMLGLAAWGADWTIMLVFMTLWSTGQHLLMPVRSSIGMELAKKAQKGKRLGQINAVGIGASIAGCLGVWWLLDDMSPDYTKTFILGGVVAIIGGIFFLAMRLPGAHLRRPWLVVNRRYWLYYVLAFLFGARKQIFITFGPWVLVKIFNQPPSIFAKLWIVGAGLGILFQPLLGRVVDRFGERVVLVADSLLVMLVCLGYGFSSYITDFDLALWLLYACFVGDQLLFGVNIARSTYISRIALKPEHVAPTLALGITINHFVSMSIPTAGGQMWEAYGHSSVFMAAGVVALLMLVFSSLIRIPPESETA